MCAPEASVSTGTLRVVFFTHTHTHANIPGQLCFLFPTCQHVYKIVMTFYATTLAIYFTKYYVQGTDNGNDVCQQESFSNFVECSEVSKSWGFDFAPVGL